MQKISLLTTLRLHDYETQGLYSNPVQYYDFLQNRVMVLFRPKYEETDADHPEFHLTLSKKQNYDTVRTLKRRWAKSEYSLSHSQMSAKVGERLSWDPIKLRFTTTHTTNGTAKAVLKRSLNQSIQEIMQPANYGSPQTTVILYEKLEVSIVELETKRSLKVAWTGIHNKEESTHNFLLPKTSAVHDLTTDLSKQVKLTPSGTNKIRVFEVSKDGKTQKEFTGSEMIGNIPDPVELYAEVMQLFFARLHFACAVGRRLWLFGRVLLLSALSAPSVCMPCRVIVLTDGDL